MDAVHELLVRYLTDDAFRTAFDDDPAGSLAQYDLTDEERDALATRDERVLELIGRAVTPDDEEPAAPKPELPTARAHPSSVPELPPIAVWLSVLPHATTTAGQTRVQWQVSLHSEQPEQAEIARNRGVVFRVDLEPAATRYAGQEHVVFRSSIGADSAAAAGSPASPSWDHDWSTPAAQAAIERVHAAAPADRFDAVLELAQALELQR